MKKLWEKTKQFARDNEDVVIFIGAAVVVVGVVVIAALGYKEFHVQDEAAALARAMEHFKSRGAVKDAGKLMKRDRNMLIYRTVIRKAN